MSKTCTVRVLRDHAGRGVWAALPRLWARADAAFKAEALRAAGVAAVAVTTAGDALPFDPRPPARRLAADLAAATWLAASDVWAPDEILRRVDPAHDALAAETDLLSLGVITAAAGGYRLDRPRLTELFARGKEAA